MKASVTPDEAARLLGVRKGAVWGMIRRKELDVFSRSPTDRRITMDSLTRRLAQVPVREAAGALGITLAQTQSLVRQNVLVWGRRGFVTRESLDRELARREFLKRQYSVPEAAWMLGISLRSAWRLIEKGELPVARLLGRTYAVVTPAPCSVWEASRILGLAPLEVRRRMDQGALRASPDGISVLLPGFGALRIVRMRQVA